MKAFCIGMVMVLTLLVQAQGPVPLDAQGDALPAGAIARLGSLRFRHDAGITCQAVSNDGKLIATGGGRSVRVWEASSGRQLFVLTIGQGGRAVTPSALAFSPDNQQLAALGAYSQGVLMVWNLRGGQARQEMMLPQREEYSNTLMDAPFLAFTSTGHVLVKNYSDRAVRQFDVQSSQEVKAYQDGAAGLTTLAMSMDGNWLAAGTENRQVVLWNLQQGKEVRRIYHEYPLVGLAFSRSGKLLASMDQDLAPRIWDVSTGKEQLQLPAKTRSVSLTFSSDDRALLVARQPDQIVRWNLESKHEEQMSLPRGWVNGPILSYGTSQQEEALLLGSTGRRGTNFSKLRRVEPGKPESFTKFDGYDTGSIFPFHLKVKGQWASIGSVNDDTLRYWDSQGRMVAAAKLPVTEQVFRSFATDAQGRHIALSCADGRIIIIDGVAGRVMHTITAFNRACYDTEFTLDGEKLIATDQRYAKVFQVKTGKELHSFEMHSIDALRSIISSDGMRIAIMTYQQEDEQMTLRILDSQTGKSLTGDQRLPVQQQNYYFSPDGRNIIFLASRGRAGGLSIMEAASGKTRYQVELPAPYLFIGNHARLSPDGQWLVATAMGNEQEQYAAIAWRLGGKGEPVVLQGHRGSVISLNFSQDSKQLLSVSSDSTMLVWDMTRYPLPTPLKLNETGYVKLWDELGNQDAAKAFAAVHRFSQYPDAAPWLSKKLLEKVTVVQPESIKDWISKLNAVKFSDREEASKQLLRNATVARPYLKAAIEQTESAESRRRLEQILEQARENTGLSDNPLQCSRAIESLELMGYAASHVPLKQLSGRQDAIGKDAREALMRLQSRVN